MGPGRHIESDRLVQRVTDWLSRWRAIDRDRTALADRVLTEEMARDVGIGSASELMELIGQGPGSARLLNDMAETLNVPLADLARSQAGLVRTLEVNCSRCSDKNRCRHELRDGTAALSFHTFCPNAYALDGLRQ
jgi:hypothetical protein